VYGVVYQQIIFLSSGCALHIPRHLQGAVSRLKRVLCAAGCCFQIKKSAMCCFLSNTNSWILAGTPGTPVVLCVGKNCGESSATAGKEITLWFPNWYQNLFLHLWSLNEPSWLFIPVTRGKLKLCVANLWPFSCVWSSFSPEGNLA
jgi:hypothetical protein